MTVMPCYDKKLEASREDFYNDLYRTRDVDCVITSGRLHVVCVAVKNNHISFSIGKKTTCFCLLSRAVCLPSHVVHV